MKPKTFDEAKAAYKPLRRTGFQPKTLERGRTTQNRPVRSLENGTGNAPTGLAAGLQRGKARSRGIRKRGPMTDRWLKAWAWLKPRLEVAGRTTCEFDFINHECWEDFAIDPVHSKKRTLWEGLDIYTVAIGCRIVHGILDEEMSHAEMEKAVLMAIELNGGLIVP